MPKNLLSKLLVIILMLGGITIPYQLTSSSNAIVYGKTPSFSFPLHVQGNQLVTKNNSIVHLMGVDRSGTEYACVQGWGIFDGPSNTASIQAMRTWHVNAVRIPLNEDCWLGINGVNPAYSGTNYQTAIMTFVKNLNAHHIIAILDLHWNAPGTTLATGQQYMADQSHAPAFWTSVGTYFKNTPGVIFDLYNEPHGISWSCWENGCITPGGWQSAGMQELVNTVRATGATQPLMLGGLNWAGDLSGWLQYMPTDPLHNLIASVHVYNYSSSNNQSYWQSNILPVAQKVPVVTGEVGQITCSGNYATSYMNWAHTHGLSYLAWTWDTWGCSHMGLVSNYNGTPTTYGQTVQSFYDSTYPSSVVRAPSGAYQSYAKPALYTPPLKPSSPTLHSTVYRTLGSTSSRRYNTTTTPISTPTPKNKPLRAKSTSAMGSPNTKRTLLTNYFSLSHKLQYSPLVCVSK